MRIPATTRKAQRGIAIILLLAVVVAGASFLLIRSFNAAAVPANRLEVTKNALVAAKEALVARAVADDNRPGSLPCPDTDDDGDAEIFVGNECPAYVGRLPWKTLGISDLRDGNSERLWYVLSRNFRDDTSAEPINSNTVATLSVAGTEPAANAMAVLIAPGAPLRRTGGAALQDRSCVIGTNCDATRRCTTAPASNTPKCNPVNYLDISGGVDNALGGPSLFSAATDATFNDRVLAVLHDEIMPLVEKRAGLELSQNLRNHFDAWANSAVVASTKGFYPWAAPFDDPQTASPGVSGTLDGLLPISAAPLVWTSASANLGSCSGVGTPQIECTVPLFALGLLTITGQVGNIATGFVDPPDGTEATVVSGVVVGGGTSTWSLNAAQERLDYTYSGSLIGLLTTVRVRAPTESAWPSSSWLRTNRWHAVTYYAVANGFSMTGGGSCPGPGNCITVQNTGAPSNDKHAVVLTTGRALAGTPTSQMPRLTTPPPADRAHYLELENDSGSDREFERRIRADNFNDQSVIVRP
jgi:hypothetical protein